VKEVNAEAAILDGELVVTDPMGGGDTIIFF
jgi:hypothetical protein